MSDLEHSEICEAFLFSKYMEKEVHYLGKLCKNNHEYENSGETLRFISDRSCVECKKLKQAERNQKRNLLMKSMAICLLKKLFQTFQMKKKPVKNAMMK